MKNWKLIPFFVCLTLFLSATAFAGDTVSVILLMPDGAWLEKTVSCPENSSLWYASYDASGVMLEAGRTPAPAQNGKAMIALSQDADTVKAFALDDNFAPRSSAEMLKNPSFLQRGWSKLAEEDYAGAIDDFTRAIQSEEDLPWPYLYRGDAYIASGETPENLAAAKADYEAALALDETLAQAYLDIADVYIRQANYEKAIEILLQGMNKASYIYEIQDKLEELDSGNVRDSSGNMRRQSGYNENGKLIWRHEYSYDAEGRIASVTAYDADGKRTGHINCQYDERGNQLIGYDYSYEDGKLQCTVREYDERDNCVKWSLYDTGGTLIQYNLYQYDEQGNSVRDNFYDLNDETGAVEFSGYNLYQYDDMGNIVRQEGYSPEGALRDYSIWSYNDGGQVKEYICYCLSESGDMELEWREVYEYNGRGDLIMETRYNADGNIRLIAMYQYDEYGDCIGVTYYDGNGNRL